jgi:hypothetical protein
MFSKVGQSLVRYYAAVRISAVAAVTWLPDDLPRDRIPIIRTSDHELPDGFDRREIILRAGRQYVVTLPEQATKLGPSRQILPN